jgi:hypothetical protein
MNYFQIHYLNVCMEAGKHSKHDIQASGPKFEHRSS